MKRLHVAVIAVYCFCHHIFHAQGIDDETISGLDKVLDSIMVKMMREGLISKKIFVQRAMEKLQTTAVLAKKYKPQVINQAYQDVKTGGLSIRPSSQRIIEEVDILGPIIGLPNSEDVIETVNLLMLASDQSLCKEALKKIDLLLASKKGFEFNQVKLLVSGLNSNCKRLNLKQSN